MQKARAAGCRTAAEANKFLEQKRNTGVEESEQGVNESAQGAGNKVLQRQNHLKGEFDASPQGVPKESPVLHPSGKDTSSAMQATSNSLLEWDITGFVGADLLSETVRRLSSNFYALAWKDDFIICTTFKPIGLSLSL